MQSNESRTLPLNGVRVLVVDDDDAIRVAVKRILINAGCEVIDASRPTDAIQAARTYPNPLDLALVDLLLPEMSGPECAEVLRSDHPEMAVGYMSGYIEMTPSVEQAEEGDELELRIGKPFAGEQLIDAIRGLLVRRSLLRFSTLQSTSPTC